VSSIAHIWVTVGSAGGLFVVSLSRPKEYDGGSFPRSFGGVGNNTLSPNYPSNKSTSTIAPTLSGHIDYTSSVSKYVHTPCGTETHS